MRKFILGVVLALAIVASTAPPVDAWESGVPAACVTSMRTAALPVGVPAQVWVGDERAVVRMFVDVPAGWYDVIVRAHSSVLPVVVVDGQDMWERVPFRVGMAEPGRIEIWAGAERSWEDDEFPCYGYQVEIRRVVPVGRKRP